MTWSGWDTPTDGWITRDDLKSELGKRGLTVKDATLSFWQRRGAIPIPGRRRIGRATHAIYPPAFVDEFAQFLTTPRSRASKIQTLQQRVRELEQRIAELEAGPVVP